MQKITKPRPIESSFTPKERPKETQEFSSSHKVNQRKFQIQELLHKQSEINKHSHNYLSFVPPNNSQATCTKDNSQNTSAFSNKKKKGQQLHIEGKELGVNGKRKCIEFPNREFSNGPLEPMARSFASLSEMSEKVKIVVPIAPSIMIMHGGSCNLIYNHLHGYITSERIAEPSKEQIIELIKEKFTLFQTWRYERGIKIKEKERLEDHAKRKTKRQKPVKFILKIYDEELNTNLSFFYSRMKDFSSDFNKLYKTTEFLLQEFIPSNLPASIVRVFRTPSATQLFHIRSNQTKKLSNEAKDHHSSVPHLTSILYTTPNKNIEKKEKTHKYNGVEYKNLYGLNPTPQQEMLAQKYAISKGDVTVIQYPKSSERGVYERAKELSRQFDRTYGVDHSMRFPLFVIDFIVDINHDFHLLQIKDYIWEEKETDFSILSSKVSKHTKGQIPHLTCGGIFCAQKYLMGPSRMISAMVQYGLLRKSWTQNPAYLLTRKIISNYNRDYKLFSKKYKLHNIFGPLLLLTGNTKQGKELENSEDSAVSSKIYEPVGICDLCNKIYKMYIFKNQKILNTNLKLCQRLIELQGKALSDWTIGDYLYLLEVFSAQLPLINQPNSFNTIYPNVNHYTSPPETTRNNPSSPLYKKNIKKKRENYYGYDPVLNPLPPGNIVTNLVKNEQLCRLKYFRPINLNHSTVHENPNTKVRESTKSTRSVPRHKHNKSTQERVKEKELASHRERERERNFSIPGRYHLPNISNTSTNEEARILRMVNLTKGEYESRRSSKEIYTGHHNNHQKQKSMPMSARPEEVEVIRRSLKDEFISYEEEFDKQDRTADGISKTPKPLVREREGEKRVRSSMQNHPPFRSHGGDYLRYGDIRNINVDVPYPMHESSLLGIRDIAHVYHNEVKRRTINLHKLRKKRYIAHTSGAVALSLDYNPTFTTQPTNI